MVQAHSEKKHHNSASRTKGFIVLQLQLNSKVVFLSANITEWIHSFTYARGSDAGNHFNEWGGLLQYIWFWDELKLRSGMDKATHFSIFNLSNTKHTIVWPPFHCLAARYNIDPDPQMITWTYIETGKLLWTGVRTVSDAQHWWMPFNYCFTHDPARV